MNEGINYLNSLAYWDGAGGFTLDNIKKLLKYLGNPQFSYKTIHIGGTNGKGSVSASVAAILGAAGYKTGLNISPHLVRLNERIVIDGLEVGNEYIDSAGLVIKNAISELNIPITFHEAITASAFIIFKEQQVDYAVIEVGLGGKFDCSNVINSEISSIVTIDYDHTHILGETLDKIAAEKAGIIRSKQGVVIGDLPPEALTIVTEVCREMRSNIHKYKKDFNILKKDNHIFYVDEKYSFEINPSLKGEHQVDNMAVACKIALLLGISSEFCVNGIANVFWPARLEKFIPPNSDKNILFDCAHNPAGIRSLTDYIKQNYAERVTMVFGALQTKDWQKMLNYMLPYVDTWIILKPESSRSLPISEIVEYFKHNKTNITYSGDDYLLCKQLVLDSKRNVVVAGSMYMVGKLRSLIVKNNKRLWERCGYN